MNLDGVIKDLGILMYEIHLVSQLIDIEREIQG